jgi:hypothetical protein
MGENRSDLLNRVDCTNSRPAKKFSPGGNYFAPFCVKLPEAIPKNINKEK